MIYLCSVCGEEVKGLPISLIEHTEEYIVEAIKEKHPEWIQKDGLCQKCYDYYKSELRGTK